METKWKIYIEKKGEKQEVIQRLKELIKDVENHKEDIFPYGFEHNYL